MQLLVGEVEVVVDVVFHLLDLLDLLDRPEYQEMMARLDILEKRAKMLNHQHHLHIHLSLVRNVNVLKTDILVILDHQDQMVSQDSRERQVQMVTQDPQDRLDLLDPWASLEVQANLGSLERLAL